MFGKVVHEEVARSIMGQRGINVISPVVELGIGRLYECQVRSSCWISIDVLCQHRHAFIGPTQVDGMQVPVDHMLEFVRQRAIIVGAARSGAVDVHIEQFALVAIGVHAGWILVL